MTGLARRLRRTLAALGLCVLSCGAAAACTVPADIAALRSGTVRAVNLQRQAADLPALATDATLTRAAQNHACDMAERAGMGHTGSDGSTLATRLRRAGYRFGLANENVAAGYPSAEAVVAAWMSSAGHRANILADGSRHAGVGVALSADGVAYWTLVTARRR